MAYTTDSSDGVFNADGSRPDTSGVGFVSNNDGDNGSFWDTFAENGGDWLRGAAAVIAAANKTPAANFNYPGAQPGMGGGGTVSNTTWIAIAVAIIILVILFLFMRRT